MADELRILYSEEYIYHIAQCLFEEGDVNPEEFGRYILSSPWADMTLKERMARLTDGLVHFLKGSYTENIEVLKHLLPRVSGDAQKYADMLSMFIPDYTVQAGFENTVQSLEALAYFTSHGTSSEFAIRPFLKKDPVFVMKYMLDWAHHEDENIRRFASEGCRPRLPWAMALPAFKQDPALILPILVLLRSDDSVFVQKSVANNLNDIAKDNPQTVLDFAESWLGSHKNTNWIVKHGCRTLLKQGNRHALSLFGSSPVKIENSLLTLKDKDIHFGESLHFSFKVLMKGKLPENLRIEYAIDFMKSNGKTARKVFKISESTPKSANIQREKAHKFIDYSTRKHYGGSHGLAILLNGQEISHQEFRLIK